MSYEERKLLTEILRVLEKIETDLRRRGKPASIKLRITLPDGKILRSGHMPLTANPKVGEQIDIEVIGETDQPGGQGNPVPLSELAFGFKLSDDTLGILTLDANGRKATFAAKAPGTAVITINDPIVTTLTETVSATIPAQVPQSILVQVSAPVPQP